MAGVLGQYAFHKYACLWSMNQRDNVSKDTTNFRILLPCLNLSVFSSLH